MKVWQTYVREYVEKVGLGGANTASCGSLGADAKGAAGGYAGRCSTAMLRPTSVTRSPADTFGPPPG